MTCLLKTDHIFSPLKIWILEEIKPSKLTCIVSQKCLIQLLAYSLLAEYLLLAAGDMGKKLNFHSEAEVTSKGMPYDHMK